MSNDVVLVTGGAGYVGSHGCKALARAGFRPVVYDSLEYGHEWAVKWGPLEIGDLAQRERLDAAFDFYRPAAIMHFAAYALVGESVADPGRYYRNNVGGTLALLEAMQAHGVRHIVFSSTCATYGLPVRLPIPEDHPQAPVNPYGMTKLVAERMLHDFATACGIRSACLRYFNAAGADPDGEIGELHEPETHLIPRVLDVAAGKAGALVVNGTDYATPDGTCIRDFVHVTDLAEAHVLALRRLLSGADCFAVNLGTGSGHSVRAVVEVASRVTGRAIATACGPRRAGDPPVLVADASLAHRLLGWRPARAAIETQIADAWRWRQRGLSVSRLDRPGALG